MGFFGDLFGGGNRRLENLMNPLLEMKLREFVIADDDSILPPSASVSFATGVARS
jgi:hypothetical protein